MMTVFAETMILRGDIPSATSINATAFILRLALYVRGTIEPIKEQLQGLECFILFSKWLSWLLRHGKTLLHPSSLSLTLNELLHFPEFSKHTNNCLTYITRHNENTGVYGNFDTGEVRRICKDERVNFDSMRYFIPFVTVTCMTRAGYNLQFSTKALSGSRNAMSGSRLK